MSTTTSTKTNNPFPHATVIEGISVDRFGDTASLFERLLHEIRRPEQSIFAAINVHIANLAFENHRLRRILQESDIVYCDGAGIKLASQILYDDPSQHFPCRLTAADWLFDLWNFMADHGCTGYYLGGEVGIVEKALTLYAEKYPAHAAKNPIVGGHHGYILNHDHLENQVIEEINHLQPDVVFVAMGCPLQEYWIDDHRHQLNTSVLYPIGATLDYLTSKVPRCPSWMGHMGLEWLFRLAIEPRRMFKRYVHGNPYFLSRMVMQRTSLELQNIQKKWGDGLAHELKGSAIQDK